MQSEKTKTKEQIERQKVKIMLGHFERKKRSALEKQIEKKLMKAEKALVKNQKEKKEKLRKMLDKVESVQKSKHAEEKVQLHETMMRIRELDQNEKLARKRVEENK